ncbi:hypothetical protein QBC34DRAFT_398008 [Podospora aff. communis PSN243]|uniref:Heterokaryon incompatibility domain-containing protein n=1 Tax=Podospora aff. communis PSN243 TaxID=3040156 RepID=A0AAV9GY98_9PEZI|nr:hypothetical protein QBC34DRAFT_398008 [Podospora aff. communis PSN243]
MSPTHSWRRHPANVAISNSPVATPPVSPISATPYRTHLVQSPAATSRSVIMQHLQEIHGHSVKATPLLMKEDQYRRFGCTFQDFHAFPGRAGWRICSDFSLKLDTTAADPNQPDLGLREPGPFLQTWLWLGLLYTVVQDKDGPMLNYEDDMVEVEDQQVTTKHLNEKLKAWRKSVLEEAKSDSASARIRMIRVEIVLQIARRVVHRNCAAVDWEPTEAETEEGPDDSNAAEVEPFVDDNLALSLMVLGETLTSAKASIMENADLHVPGWHSEDTDEGWGPSRAVYELMKTKWCPRQLHILRNQLKGHATLMYCAYLAYSESEQMNKHSDFNKQLAGKENKDKRCTKDRCMFKSEQAGSYITGPAPRSHVHRNCELQGPEMKPIIDILARSKHTGEIPLVTITAGGVGGRDIELGVRACKPDDKKKPIYATISHVWSDGWGNESSNKLYTCQLQFIYSMLKHGTKLWRDEADDSVQTKFSFWMDTLVIPVESEEVKKAIKDQEPPSSIKFKDLKKEAIAQIHRVFTASEFTIVVDNGLADMDSTGSKPCERAMRILASGWMKRLWTLQEAFLSQRLFVAFKDPIGHYQPVQDLDDLIQSGLNTDNGFVKATERHLCESLMDADRRDQIQQSGRKARSGQANEINRVLAGYSLIANAWRAARWRTTINPAHETLALATLLGLPYDEKIANAGVTKFDKEMKDDERNDKLDGLVCAFWDLFNEQWPGSIPPGLIFLPGDKVQKEGYRWAPRTFMSVFTTDYPDPLAPVQRTGYKGTSIDANKRGLHVRYPGFILHCHHGKNIRNKVLCTEHSSVQGNLVFPGSGSLLEWYEVKSTGDEPSTDQIQSIIDSKNNLAIILTRPDPKELPYEIGLLVEIKGTAPAEDRGQGKPKTQGAAEESLSGNDNQQSGRVAYCCRIIRRVHIRRDSSRTLWDGTQEGGAADSDPPLLRLMPDNLKPGAVNGEEDDLCIGQALDIDQEWYVDGFESVKRQPNLEEVRPAVKAPPRSQLNRLLGIGGQRQRASPRPSLTSEARTMSPAVPGPSSAPKGLQKSPTNPPVPISEDDPRIIPLQPKSRTFSIKAWFTGTGNDGKGK